MNALKSTSLLSGNGNHDAKYAGDCHGSQSTPPAAVSTKTPACPVAVILIAYPRPVLTSRWAKSTRPGRPALRRGARAPARPSVTGRLVGYNYCQRRTRGEPAPEEGTEMVEHAGVTAPWRPTKAELAAATGRTVPDVIAPGLGVLFCGINPGLYTAAVGHHFARPGNRFWKVLHLAGFTDRLLSPFEETALLASGIGITNLVARGPLSQPS